MESTLSLKRDDLCNDTALFLGYQPATNWDDSVNMTPPQVQVVRCVNSGIRQFYFPPPAMPNQDSSYDWSFLKPVQELALAAGANTIPLPDDFGGIEGTLVLKSSAGSMWWPIDITGVGTVYAKQSELPSTTGRPLIACIEPLKGTTAQLGQRFQLRIWPIADQAYTLQVQYYILPEALDGSRPFVYGGMQHAETVLESCLAIAEQRLDDSSQVHSQKFKERLIASISMDRRSKPQLLGYNRDKSDYRYPWDRADWRHWDWSGIRVGGQLY